MTFATHMRRAIAVCALTTMSLAACSATTTSSTKVSGDAVSACDLLTTAEATEAMGKPMADGTESDFNGGTVCTWLSTNPPSEGLENPTKLTVALLPMRPSAQQIFELLASSPDDRVVPGLGDRAVADCTFGDTDYCGELYIMLGEQYLNVDMNNFLLPGDYERSELLGIVTGVAGQAILRVRK